MVPATELDASLRPTFYCDSDDPDVREVSRDLTATTGCEREAAVRLFEFVRDGIAYAFGPWNVTASETLATRRGTCTNKANLLVALFRASGIPGACGVLRVDARRYFGALTPAYFDRHVRAESTHVYAAARLDGEWVRCDPSTDRGIAEKTGHFCPQTALVEWDGYTDAMDILDPEHVHADLGLFADIDDVLAKSPRTTPEFTARTNELIDFIRDSAPYRSAAELKAGYNAAAQRARGPAWTF
jgi:hypothetical protein